MSELQRAFDAHLHIIDPSHPLIENNGYLPDPFTVTDYRARLQSLPDVGVEIAGGAVVSGSFQGFDQGYLIGALRELGEAMSASPSCPMRPPMIRSGASTRPASRLCDSISPAVVRPPSTPSTALHDGSMTSSDGTPSSISTPAPSMRNSPIASPHCRR
jgi:hypothetical protein